MPVAIEEAVMRTIAKLGALAWEAMKLVHIRNSALAIRLQLTALVWAAFSVGPANAAFVEYIDRASFYSQLGTVVLDEYEYPGRYNDVGMTAVINETHIQI